MLPKKRNKLVGRMLSIDHLNWNRTKQTYNVAFQMEIQSDDELTH